MRGEGGRSQCKRRREAKGDKRRGVGGGGEETM